MKTVLILGATSDLAQALARRFGDSKYDLLLAARRPDALSSLLTDLQVRTGTQAQVLSFDALQPETHKAFYDALPVKPDVTICVFGYLGNQLKAEQNGEECRKIIDTNFSGAVSILEVVAADYSKRKAGCIIGITSVAGDRGRQSNYIYGSAKAGFTTYLQGLRNRLFHCGVHVLTVKPGFMHTAMTAGMALPARLTASPEQAATAIFKAFKRKRNAIYVLWMWRWVMLIVRSIPEGIFKRLKM